VKKYIKILFLIQIFLILFVVSGFSDPPSSITGIEYFRNKSECYPAAVARSGNRWAAVGDNHWTCAQAGVDCTKWTIGACSGIYFAPLWSADAKVIFYCYAINQDVWDDYLLSLNDTDGDGICNNLDLYPGDTHSINYTIHAWIYDNNQECVGVVGDSSCRGILPPGYSKVINTNPKVLSYDDMVAMFPTYCATGSLHHGAGIITGGDPLPLPNPYDPPPNPDPPPPNPIPDPENPVTDNSALNQIVGNTSITNQHLENISHYLSQINKNTSAIAAKDTTVNVNVTGGTSQVDFPTAEDIATANYNKFNNSSETYDHSVTDNIDDYTISSDTESSIKTQYSDRFNEFFTSVKGSDLFSVPFELFHPDLPDDSESSKTISIGKWGGEVDNSISVDMSDYDTIWESLRLILMVLAGYTAFKIVVVKHA